MKSILLKFADSVLSKNEMKGLKGGNGYACGSCPASGGYNGYVTCYQSSPGSLNCFCPSSSWEVCGINYL